MWPFKKKATPWLDLGDDVFVNVYSKGETGLKVTIKRGGKYLDVHIPLSDEWNHTPIEDAYYHGRIEKIEGWQ